METQGKDLSSFTFGFQTWKQKGVIVVSQVYVYFTEEFVTFLSNYCIE